MNTYTIQTYQHRLIEMIQTKYPLSDRVAEAFQRIPRHLFVSHYYTHIPGTREWKRNEYTETVEWYDQIYQDQGLVTKVDEHGRSLSSSSQPSIMACMLETLDVKPGMCVLEIGTGTGYNAALLATVTGDPHLVTTIDIDTHAVKQAQYALSHVVGEGVSVLQGDGVQGYSDHAPYDRIIVTASTSTIPQTWLTQLTSQGILVCVIQPSYALLGGVLKAERKDKGLCGTLVSTASFMVLRDEVYAKRQIQIDSTAPICESFHFQFSLFHPHLLRENPHFAFFFYSLFPDMHVFQKTKGETLVFYQETSPQGYLVFRQSLVEFHGDRSTACMLWNRLIRLYALWVHCALPKITDYQFEMDMSGEQALFLVTSEGTVWPFRNENQHGELPEEQAELQ